MNTNIEEKILNVLNGLYSPVIEVMNEEQANTQAVGQAFRDLQQRMRTIQRERETGNANLQCFTIPVLRNSTMGNPRNQHIHSETHRRHQSRVQNDLERLVNSGQIRQA